VSPLGSLLGLLATRIVIGYAWEQGLRVAELSLEPQKELISPRSWYGFARDVMKARDLEEVMSGWKGREPVTDVFLDILLQGSNDWGQIWGLTRPRLEEYKQKFESVWNPINDLVLSHLSQLSKSEWTTDEIRVHFADCLNGGFAWHDSIAFATLPDLEVQKKFLAHELSELITPSHRVSEELEREGLDPGVTHTVVDMLACLLQCKGLHSETRASKHREKGSSAQQELLSEGRRIVSNIR